MPYATNTIYKVKKGPKNLGNQLGRLAVDLDFSVQRVSAVTGATRQTVYNWFVGGDVLSPYRALVQKLIHILETSTTAENAWKRVHQEFDLKT